MISYGFQSIVVRIMSLSSYVGDEKGKILSVMGNRHLLDNAFCIRLSIV